jgi:hypothetical protein
MANDDALIRLVTELRDVQVANLEVQRKLYEIVLAQNERLEKTSAPAAELQERGRVLQDRSMDMLVAQRRFMLYGLPGLAIFVIVIVVLVWLGRWFR